MTDQPGVPSLCNLSVHDFAAAVASECPAPGGGAVAALAAALGSALVAMVVRLTAGRARYAAYDAELRGVLVRADALQQTLIGLVDADAAAYNTVMAAYRLPKETDPQEADRVAAIQAALRVATDVPLAVAATCVEVLRLAGQAATHGNRNATGDAAGAALMAHAGLRIAARNVRSNLRGIRDEGFVAEAGRRAVALLDAGEQALAAALRAADAGA